MATYELRILDNGNWTTGYALTDDGIVREDTDGAVRLALDVLRNNVDEYRDARFAVVTVEDGVDVLTEEI